LQQCCPVGVQHPYSQVRALHSHCLILSPPPPSLAPSLPRFPPPPTLPPSLPPSPICSLSLNPPRLRSGTLAAADVLGAGGRLYCEGSERLDADGLIRHLRELRQMERGRGGGSGLRLSRGLVACLISLIACLEGPHPTPPRAQARGLCPRLITGAAGMGGC
jgi:hypothetical protein